MKRFLPAAGIAALTLILGGSPASPAAPAARIAGPFGTGAGAVWLLRPPVTPRTIVIFAHGWKHSPPSPSHPWVEQFRPWLDHLLAGGSAIIFPRYQLGGDEPGIARVTSFEEGLREGFARLGLTGLPVVAVGYSYGASLVFYYAANARRWRLPAPEAVVSVFPAWLIPGATLPELPKTMRVLIQVGDRDTVAGRAGAQPFWAWLASHPPSRRRLEIVRSGPALTATHAAPKLSTPGARRAFWNPLDNLIAQSR